MGVPSFPIRNFSKFHAMSVLLTGFQIRKWGLKKKLSQFFSPQIAFPSWPTWTSGSQSHLKVLAETFWGMWKADARSLHSPQPGEEIEKKLLAVSNKLLRLRLLMLMATNIQIQTILLSPCQTCRPWTRSHCLASHASTGWLSPHHHRSPDEKYLSTYFQMFWWHI